VCVRMCVWITAPIESHY